MNNIYKADLSKATKENTYYSLAMFPYPSGAGLHVGHGMNFTANDIVARFKRMQGFTVINPIGWDSFGLPTENYAMKVGKPAAEVTAENIAQYKKQCELMDWSYDRDREVATSSPEYYKWTQWIFQELYKAGLVYKKDAYVNRCPNDQTVLANDQVVDGHCERCGAEIIQKKHPQWFIKITDYADKLINDLDLIDRPEETKSQQKYWIGRSEGAEIDFRISGADSNTGDSSQSLRSAQNDPKITVFTTRPDTLFGVTALVLAPENASIDAYIPQEYSAALEEYRKVTSKKTSVERQQDAETKSGVFSGCYAIHPLTKKQVPVWFADYVLMDYATGAVMFVPAHDERDFSFAKKHDIEITQVIDSPEYDAALCYTGEGKLINSGEFNGINNIEAKKAVTDHLEKQGLGKKKITYKLRDWSVSRQRYWGSPIPVYYTFNSDEKVPYMEYTKGNKAFQPGLPIVPRNVIQCLVKDRNSDNFVFLKWAHDNDVSAFFGGIESTERPEDAVVRELLEEGGFTDVSNVRTLAEYHLKFYHPTKKRNQYSICTCLYAEVDLTKTVARSTEEQAIATIVTMSPDEFFAQTKNDTSVFAMNELLGKEQTISSIMVDRYNAYNPHPDKDLRIPHLIPTEELPVILPLDLGNYKPQGKSPLADHATFPYYTAADGKVYLRECDTLDTFMCSSFYYLRFVDPTNTKELISKELAEKALPVDFYIGGKEHTYGHLLYSRFIHKFLFDQGYLNCPEPFQKLFHQGMVLGPDGRKMSKRWGNVITPEDLVKKYGKERGADVLRTYTMFMGPLDIEKAWNDGAVDGTKRFLDRIERMQDFITPSFGGKAEESLRTGDPTLPLRSAQDDVSVQLHKTIKGITEDIEKLKFNTAVSKMMVFVNHVYEVKSITKDQFAVFLQLLAPFATRLAQEIWEKLAREGSIHLSKWPQFDENMIAEDTLSLPVQIGGKMRGTIDIKKGLSQDEVMSLIHADERFQKHLEGQEIKKIIYVPNKIVNVII